MSPYPATRPPGHAAAASLWSQAGWVMPAMVTVSVFSVLVSLSLLFATVQPALARFLRGDFSGELPTGSGPYELRSPERAVDEAVRGMLRA